MTDIAIHRKHTLGLARAREIAWKWAEDVEEQFDMECAVEEGEHEDVVHFSRSGVKGTLRVRGDTFDLKARLGLLLGAFKKTIEGEIEKNLDQLLAMEQRAERPAARAAAKSASGSASRPGAKAAPRKKG